MWPLNRKLKNDSNGRRGWWLLIIITTLWLLWMTLRPDRTLNSVNLIPFAEHSQALTCLINSDCLYQRRAFWFLLINIAGNIIVFIPLGIGLAGVLHQVNPWQTIRRVALGGFLLSLMIELLQLTIPSRATDIDDLIFNTLGVTLGALFFLFLQRLSR
jgi:glycopeptide antibiotics resistance protein